MGVISYIGKRLILFGFIFVAVVFVLDLPPYDMTFTSYSVKPPVSLKGPLAINNKLNNAERLFENELKGPEGLTVYKGELYTGVHGGHIVKIKNNKLVPVIKFGEACEGVWEEDKCGRVLGLVFDHKGALYAVDTYYGVFKVNLTSGEVFPLVTKGQVIDNKPVKLPNCVDVASDGIVYWSDSSTSHELFDGVFTFLGDGNGRLIKTDIKKKTHEVLLDNLHFPNGVVLSDDESFILVSETAALRVIRYYLKGPKKGTSDVFIDGLPGMPDNLKRDAVGGFFIPLLIPLDADKPHIQFLLAPYPSARKFIARFITLIESSFKYIDNNIYPHEYLRKAIHFIGHFEPFNLINGDRVTIIRTNSNGEVVESLHATDGKISCISDVEYFNGAFYLASPSNPYLGRVVSS